VISTLPREEAIIVCSGTTAYDVPWSDGLSVQVHRSVQLDLEVLDEVEKTVTPQCYGCIIHMHNMSIIIFISIS